MSKETKQLLKSHLLESRKESLELMAINETLKETVSEMKRWLADKDGMYKELLSTKDGIIEALKNKLADFEHNLV